MRVACLDLPALPLQLVWRREPELRAQPVVVIDEDRPQGSVLWACERARAAGVLPGQRYAHALARTDRVTDCIAACERALALAPDEEVADLLERMRNAVPRELHAA